MVRVVKNLPSVHVKPRIHFFQAGQAPELPTDTLFMTNIVTPFTVYNIARSVRKPITRLTLIMLKF